MFFLFLTKKPIVFFWLSMMYLFTLLILILLFSISHPLNVNIFQIGALVCIPFMFLFYRVYRYFCIGYFSIIGNPNLSFRAIPLRVFRNPFFYAVGIYFLLIFLNASFLTYFEIKKYFIITISITTIIYEKAFLYVAKWTIVFEMAKHGVNISPKEIQGSINEMRQIFLSSFSKAEVDG